MNSFKKQGGNLLSSGYEEWVIDFFKKDLGTKLKNEYVKFNSEKFYINYENYFNYCEIEINQFPIKFKAKWESHTVNLC